MTEDCVHLKDDIETLIKAGRVGQYKRNDTPRRDTREVKEIEDDVRPFNEFCPLQEAFCVSRPEDFHIPDGLEDNKPLFTHNRWEKFPSAMVIFGDGFSDV